MKKLAKKKRSDLDLDADILGLVIHPPSPVAWSALTLWATRGLILTHMVNWTKAERATATRYAARVYAAASDSILKIGKKPAVIDALEKEVHEVFRADSFVTAAYRGVLR